MEFVILDEYPQYEIHTSGRIYRIASESKNGRQLKRRELHPTKAKNGYKTVKLINKDGVIVQLYLHRLVWFAFNGDIPKGYEIDHISTNRSCNALEGLRMVSHKENCNNPRSLKKYKQANALEKGKFNREKMIAAKSKESYDRLVNTYNKLKEEYGTVGIWQLMKTGHCGYARAKKIIEGHI